MSLAASIIEKARVRLWKRQEFTSEPLRRHFREKHRVDVGLYSYGCFDQWRMPGPIRVGRYCSIAKTVRSAPINHPLEAITTSPVLYEKKFGAVDEDIHWDDTLEIEDDVWIGHNAILLPGCKFVGRGAVIGAGAIVTKDVPRYAIVAGNPAKKLKDRFPPELATALDASRWWELDPAGIRALIAQNPELVFRPTSDLLHDPSMVREAA